MSEIDENQSRNNHRIIGMRLVSYSRLVNNFRYQLSCQALKGVFQFKWELEIPGIPIALTLIYPSWVEWTWTPTHNCNTHRPTVEMYPTCPPKNAYDDNVATIITLKQNTSYLKRNTFYQNRASGWVLVLLVVFVWIMWPTESRMIILTTVIIEYRQNWITTIWFFYLNWQIPSHKKSPETICII